MIIDEEGWEKCKKDNGDCEYGKYAIDVAQRVMDLLEDTPDEKVDAHKLISQADLEGELSGFQAGCVAGAVTCYHSKGELFRQSWNKMYGEQNEGVVNPAIITIEDKT